MNVQVIPKYRQPRNCSVQYAIARCNRQLLSVIGPVPLPLRTDAIPVHSDLNAQVWSPKRSARLEATVKKSLRRIGLMVGHGLPVWLSEGHDVHRQKSGRTCRLPETYFHLAGQSAHLRKLEGANETTEEGRLWLNDVSRVRIRPEYRNHVWSYALPGRRRLHRREELCALQDGRRKGFQDAQHTGRAQPGTPCDQVKAQAELR